MRNKKLSEAKKQKIKEKTMKMKEKNKNPNKVGFGKVFKIWFYSGCVIFVIVILWSILKIII